MKTMGMLVSSRAVIQAGVFIDRTRRAILVTAALKAEQASKASVIFGRFASTKIKSFSMNAQGTYYRIGADIGTGAGMMQGLDFVHGFVDPGPPDPTPGGYSGAIARKNYDELR